MTTFYGEGTPPIDPAAWRLRVTGRVISELRLDVDALRALGVAGLIDSGAPPEHVRFRIARVAYKGREGRRFERGSTLPGDDRG